MTIEETRKAIEKYQKEHPLHFGTMIDVTAISSKEGADIISQTIERVRNKVDEDTELWCICEMAKMYMQGVRPVYPVRPKGEWYRTGQSFINPNKFRNYGCSICRYELDEHIREEPNFCPNCGAKMKGGTENDCEN